jgi:glycosyltransferase involved in cell wall biosynthesis
MPKVSIVIPAYNAMRYLPKTLDSVLQQTFNDFEVLIINDGSSDAIIEWVSKNTDTRVQLITQSNQGVSAARNTGIASAQGEYIAFLDADDLWESTHLEKQVSYLDNNPTIGVVYTWTQLIDEYDRPTGRIFASHASGMIWQELLEKDVISTGSSAMVRRICLDSVGGFDTELAHAEDLELWLRIARQYQIGVIKEPLTMYRQHPHNTTKNREKMLHGLRMVFEKAFATAPIEILHKRNNAYASLFLGFAWLAIDDRNTKQAAYYRKQAYLHHPQVCFTERYMRLNCAIAMLNLFGSQGYDTLRNITRNLKQQISGITTPPKAT